MTAEKANRWDSFDNGYYTAQLVVLLNSIEVEVHIRGKYREDSDLSVSPVPRYSAGIRKNLLCAKSLTAETQTLENMDRPLGASSVLTEDLWRET